MTRVLTSCRPAALVKPKVRGWIHLGSLVLFLAAGAALVVVAAGWLPATATAGIAIYVATVLGLFGVSALYHLKKLGLGRCAHMDAPRWVGVPGYIALGWVAVFVLGDLLHNAGVSAPVLLLVGGLLYTAGAVFYASR